jgi:hypothetical protein
MYMMKSAEYMSQIHDEDPMWKSAGAKKEEGLV